MRWIVALYVLSLAAPAPATLRVRPEVESPAPNGHLLSGRGARPDFLNAETSANGLGWKQFVMVSGCGAAGLDPVSANMMPELASWALMMSGLALTGSLLRRHSLSRI